MKDFTREELAEMKAGVRGYLDAAARDRPMDGGIPLIQLFERLGGEHEILLRLIDMASRAVSVETVRKLAKYDAAPLTGDETRRAAGEFAMAAARDLRPSAEALARSAGEGLLRSLGLDKETR